MRTISLVMILLLAPHAQAQWNDAATDPPDASADADPSASTEAPADASGVEADASEAPASSGATPAPSESLDAPAVAPALALDPERPPVRTHPRFRAASIALASVGGALTVAGVGFLSAAGFMSLDSLDSGPPPDYLVFGGSVGAAVGVTVLFIGIYMMIDYFDHRADPPNVVRF